MVDRWLFGPLVQSQIENVNRSSCKTGWSPMPEGFRQLRNEFRKEVLTTDCSSFDWTFPEWVVDVITEALLEMCRGCPDWFVTAVKMRIDEVLGARCLVILPDGTVLRKKVRGIMPSGWLLTILVNSLAQLIINALAWLREFPELDFPLLWGMGDDVIMENPLTEAEVERFITRLNTLGVLIKQHSRDREFAGFRFEGAKVTPLYPEKHRFLINHAEEKVWEELANSLKLLYALSDAKVYAEISEFVESRTYVTTSMARAWAFGMVVDLGCKVAPASML